MQDQKGTDASAVISQGLPGSSKALAGVTSKAYRLLVVTLLLRPFGNLSLAWGMRHFSEALSVYPSVYLRALLNPFVALGIGMLILALLTRMALLSVADLSFVLPLTATGYLFSALLGKMFLNEQVSAGRWAGTLFIFLGIALVGSTPVRSAGKSQTASLE
jgi:drug/metabolite transporter (DMT)-like permease